MKRLFSISLLLLFCGLTYSQKIITLSFDELDFRLKQTENLIEIVSNKNDVRMIGTEEAPALPYFPYRVLLPLNTDSVFFSVNYSERSICEGVKMMANPRITSISKQSCSKDVRCSNESVSCPVNYHGVMEMDGFKYAYFTITPFLYDAQSATLHFISELKLSVTVCEGLQKEHVRHPQKSDIDTWVVNPEDIDEFYPSYKIEEYSETGRSANSMQVDYLIITSDGLSESFKKLLNWKIKKGIRAKIITLDDLYENYTEGSDQLRIKYCLNDYYENYGLKYVLLGGDDSVVPVQSCYVNALGSSEIGPTDLFYGCFNGQFDWNDSINNLIGEIVDNPNLKPQIYVTRVPVRTASDVEAFTNKLLKYESNPARSNYVTRLLLAGKDGTTPSTGQSNAKLCADDIYNNYINPHWTAGNVDWLFDTYSTLGTQRFTKTDFTTQFNSGYHLMHVNCHGNKQNWNTANGAFGIYSAGDLENINSTIVVTSACETNWFDYEPCLSEVLLRNPNGGSLAYFGSTRDSYGAEHNYAAEAHLFCAKFFENLFNGLPSASPYSFGAVAARVKTEMADDVFINHTNYSSRWHEYYFNPMGDPEMPIYTDNPSDFTNVSVSKSGTNVTVNTGGVSDCRIALTSIDGGNTYFDVADGVSSHTFTNVNCPFYVAVTKHNYVPYIDDTYQFSGTKIMGNAFIGSSSTYYIDNLPSGMTVEWSLSSTANCQVTNNSPATNQCTVTSNTSNYSVTLTATIKKDGVTLTTRTKLLTGGSSFTGTYEQASCSDYGVTTPGISQTAIPSSRTMFVYQGCIVTLLSEYFRGKELGISGPYSNIDFIGNNKIRLALCPWNVSQPLVLTVYDASCPNEGIQFTFYAIPTSNLNGNYSLDITSVGGQNYEVGLTRNENNPDEQTSEESANKTVEANKDNEKEDGSWMIEVYNVRSGRKVVHEELTDSKYLLNTSGWESGMYVVRAIVGEEALAGKISVK